MGQGRYNLKKKEKAKNRINNEEKDEFKYAAVVASNKVYWESKVEKKMKQIPVLAQMKLKIEQEGKQPDRAEIRP